MSDEKLHVDINAIIKIAEKFKCCPICGYKDANKQFCKKCKQKFDERESAFFFSAYLRKIKIRGDLDNISKEKKEKKFQMSAMQVE